MNSSKFDAIVKNRTQEKVNERVECFRKSIDAAFRKLFDGVNMNQKVFDNNYKWITSTDTVKKCLGNCHRTRGVGFTNEWPKELWDHESEVVTKQLLSVMDEMQKALIAPAPSEDGPTPITSEEVIS